MVIDEHLCGDTPRYDHRFVGYDRCGLGAVAAVGQGGFQGHVVGSLIRGLFASAMPCGPELVPNSAWGSAAMPA